jgi:hypothetical protein
MSIENPSKAAPSLEELRTMVRETPEEAQEHNDAEANHIQLFMETEVAQIPELDEATRAHVLAWMQAHAGTWREFDNQDIRLAANPTIEGDTLVLIFSLYEAQEVEERIPLR